MATAYAARRLLQRVSQADPPAKSLFRIFRRINFSMRKDLPNSSVFSRSSFWELSQRINKNGKHAYLVDTLAMVRQLEAQGLPSKHSEAITEVLNDSLEHVAESLVSKIEMQQFEMVQEAALSKFKTEVTNSQDHHFSLLQLEIEKLRTDIDHLRSELKYEITNKLDRKTHLFKTQLDAAKYDIIQEIHLFKTQLEAAKYDAIKYCIGAMVSVMALEVGLLCFVH